jgi:hypothetical protein
MQVRLWISGIEQAPQRGITKTFGTLNGLPTGRSRTATTWLGWVITDAGCRGRLQADGSLMLLERALLDGQGDEEIWPTRLVALRSSRTSCRCAISRLNLMLWLCSST